MLQLVDLFAQGFANAIDVMHSTYFKAALPDGWSICCVPMMTVVSSTVSSFSFCSVQGGPLQSFDLRECALRISVPIHACIQQLSCALSWKSVSSVFNSRLLHFHIEFAQTDNFIIGVGNWSVSPVYLMLIAPAGLRNDKSAPAKWPRAQRKDSLTSKLARISPKGPRA
eukprot:1158022-Pelagomonas_calceolata.AAC.12